MVYHNILIQALFNIGDVIICTSAIALLKKAYPKAYVTVMVRPSAREIVENNPIIDDVLIIDYKSKSMSLSYSIKLIKELRSRKFDLSISFDGKHRSTILIYFAGIPVRVLADGILYSIPNKRKKLYTHIIPPTCDLDKSHKSEVFQSIIKDFANIDETESPVIGRIKAINKHKAQQLLSSLSQSRFKVALCVKGTLPTKNWPQSKFADLIIKLNSLYDCAFFITGMSQDREYVDEIISITSLPVRNFCGLTNLLDLAALLDDSDLFITVDTGALHIASTTKVPIVALYGSTTPVQWGPMNKRNVVIYQNFQCSPCSFLSLDSCPEHACMNTISVDMVIKSVESLNCLK